MWRQAFDDNKKGGLFRFVYYGAVDAHITSREAGRGDEVGFETITSQPWMGALEIVANDITVNPKPRCLSKPPPVAIVLLGQKTVTGTLSVFAGIYCTIDFTISFNVTAPGAILGVVTVPLARF
jgi:hypothetical protein